MKFIFTFLLIVACSSDSSLEPKKNFFARETHVHLIELLEKGSETQMPEELMQEIFSVYNKKLLYNSLPNKMNLFMKCVKVHKDLLRIMKSAPTEVIRCLKYPQVDVIQNFEYLQNEFLQELHFLKTRNLADGEQLSAGRLIEAAYIRFLIFHISQCKDFYNLLISEAVDKNSFSPAIAVALHLQTYGVSAVADIEIPDIYVLPTKNHSERVLLLCLNKSSGTVIIETVFFDECYIATKIGLTGNCFGSPMLDEKLMSSAFSSARFVVPQAGNSFFRWNGHNKLLLKSDDKKVGVESFELDYKVKRWIRHWVFPEDISLFF
ncbi:MAG: hypothetical protein LBT90_01595 [Holosporaceae bacterium]|jgi:hypothetical protein|nr:hypothetical protein [Holosporaceae bacterium]